MTSWDYTTEGAEPWGMPHSVASKNNSGPPVGGRYPCLPLILIFL